MKNPYDTEQGQTLTEHLTELRDRLVKSAWAIAVGAILCWIISERLYEVVRAPIVPYLPSGGLVFTSPLEKFMAHLKLAGVGGVIFACPVWLYQLWKFVAPGLYANERKYSAMFIISGVVLFLTGVFFVYFLVLPTAFHYLLNFGADGDKPMITITEYFSFFTTMTMVFGAAFELPLVIVLLGLIGLVNQRLLREKRRYAVVALALISAIVTPPDVLSMLMLLVPLLALYEISILLVGMIAKKREGDASH